MSGVLPMWEYMAAFVVAGAIALALGSYYSLPPVIVAGELILLLLVVVALVLTDERDVTRRD